MILIIDVIGQYTFCNDATISLFSSPYVIVVVIWIIFHIIFVNLIVVDVVVRLRRPQIIELSVECVLGRAAYSKVGMSVAGWWRKYPNTAASYSPK